MTVHCRARRRGWAAGAAIALSLASAACTSGHRVATGNPVSDGATSASSTGSPGGSGAGSPNRTGTAGASATASGTAASKPSGGGSEGATGSPGDRCLVTTSAAVGAAFAATVAHEQVGTTGIGSPLCTFSLSRTGAGPFGAVSATVVSGYPAAAFAQSRRSTTGAQPLAGLGLSAYYVPANHTLKVLTGSGALTLQYSGFLAGGYQPTAARIRASLIALAKAYLSQN
jgi:hypothetical protein